MRHRTSSYVRPRSFESLEPRHLMAGNVTAEVRDGHLFVSGDTAANEIEIIGTGVLGQFQIRGLDGTTRVNGSLGRVTLSGVMGGAYIYLGDGHDRVELSNFYTFGDVRIDGGRGNDRLFVGTGSLGNHVGVNLYVTGGAGNDDMVVRNTDVENNLTFYPGSNIDTVGISSTREDFGMAGARVGGSIFVRSFTTDFGDRTIWISGMMFNRLEVAGTPGPDDLSIIDCNAPSANVYVSFGLGDDEVFILESHFSRFYNYEAGVAADYLGADSDTIRVESSEFDYFYASLGTDDDTVTLTDVTTGTLNLRGGEGDDSLYYFGDNHFGSVGTNSFETFWSDVILRWFSDYYWDF
jgi:hypothetical protein